MGQDDGFAAASDNASALASANTGPDLPSSAAGQPCPKCGARDFSTSYMACPEKARMDRDGLCFNCAFWSLRADIPKHKRTIIDGRSYGPGDRTTGSFRGMGGRRFDIEYADGRRITTFDLWSAGDIPAHWRDSFPDNARFLGSAEAVRVGDATCWNPSDSRQPCYPLPKDNPPRPAPAESAASPDETYGSRKHEGEAEVTNTDEVQQ